MMKNIKKIDRREFVKNVSGIALGASFLPMMGCNDTGSGKQTRLLGRTGEKVSMLGIGGWHAGDPSLPDEVAIQIIRTAIDRGVNFMDNAWLYQEGRSEIIMGRALQDGYRKKVMLMTKLMARTVEEAKRQMETSLNRYQLDSVDLMQFHDLRESDNAVDAIYNHGLIEWAEEQRSQGVIKYIGFTVHSDPRLVIDMIQRGYPWDTVQIPLNIVDFHRTNSFEHDVLPLAIEKNIGVIGMKTNDFGRLGKSGIATPVEGLRYTMSLPVSTVVSGIDSLEILEENLGLFDSFNPMTPAEKLEILNRSKGHTDSLETYRFDYA